MTSKLTLKTLLAVVAALVVVGAASRSVAAEHGKPNPGHGGQRITVTGVISAIETNDQGTLITLHRGDADVRLQVTSDTRIVPPGATPAIGDTVHAVAQKAKTPGEPLVAVVLNLAAGQRGPDDPATPPNKRVCGTIAALPADPLNGTWTVTVPNVAAYQLIVDADTKITPQDAAPEVGGALCFQARQTDLGWLALSIHLDAKAKPGGDKHGSKALVIHGTVVGPLPEDRSGDWTLDLAIEGADNQLILVTKDTQIAGELVAGAKVVVHAQWVTDAVGGRTLVAEKIAVCDDSPDTPKAQSAVRIKGLVKSVAEAAWTITAKDGDIVVGITADTKIIGLAAGEDPVGRKVEARALRAADGTLVAHMLRIEKD